MYPAIIIGDKLEKMGLSVYTHSTTRSPIGVCDASGYPITSGHALKSFYDKERVTYIYNLKKCDAALIITDSASDAVESKDELCYLLEEYDIKKIFFVRGI